MLSSSTEKKEKILAQKREKNTPIVQAMIQDQFDKDQQIKQTLLRTNNTRVSKTLMEVTDEHLRLSNLDEPGLLKKLSIAKDNLLSTKKILETPSTHLTIEQLNKKFLSSMKTDYEEKFNEANDPSTNFIKRKSAQKIVNNYETLKEQFKAFPNQAIFDPIAYEKTITDFHNDKLIKFSQLSASNQDRIHFAKEVLAESNLISGNTVYVYSDPEDKQKESYRPGIRTLIETADGSERVFRDISHFQLQGTRLPSFTAIQFSDTQGLPATRSTASSSQSNTHYNPPLKVPAQVSSPQLSDISISQQLQSKAELRIGAPQCR
jgi:hypothetical protein